MYKTRHLPNTRIDVADALRGIYRETIFFYIKNLRNTKKRSTFVMS